MKKTISLLLAAALAIAAFGLAGCRKKPQPAAEDTTAEPVSETVSGETEAGGTTAPEQTATGDASEPSETQNGAQTTAAQGADPAQETTAAGQSAPSPQGEYVSRNTMDGSSLIVKTDAKGVLKPGDAFTVSVRIADAALFASLSMYLEFDPAKLTVEDTESGDAGLMDAFRTRDGRLSYAGLVMETVNLTDSELFSVVFRVNDGAPAGTVSVAAVAEQYMIGTDASGARTKDLTAGYAVTEVPVLIG